MHSRFPLLPLLLVLASLCCWEWTRPGNWPGLVKKKKRSKIIYNKGFFQPPYHHLACCWLCNWLYIRVGKERWVYWGKGEPSWCRLNVCAELLVGGLITCHPWDRVSTAVFGLYTVVAWGWNLSTATRGKRYMLKIDHVLHERFMKIRMVTFIFKWKLTHFWISQILSWYANLGLFFFC